MELAEVKKIYDAYNLFELFESDNLEPKEDLVEWHRETLSQVIDVDPEALEFAYYVIDDFHVEKGSYWIDWAILFISHAKITEKNITYLEKVVSDLDKYGVLTTTVEKAARRLGSIAPYPNNVLREIIELDIKPDRAEWDETFIPMLKVSAYAGYIMTATDFQTGFDALNSMQGSGEVPTVEKAEAFIEQWRRKNRNR